MSKPQSLKETRVHDRTVFLRTEFNVALDEEFSIVDDSRIVASLRSIEYLLANGAKLVICSHIGRPWGAADESKSLKHLVAPLGRMIKQDVRFSPACVGETREQLQSALRPGNVLLLENVRYNIGENNNDPSFAEELAKGIDVYVNDAFGNSHRSHASMVGVPRLVPDKAMGFLLEDELRILTEFLEHRRPPAVAVVGGAKITGKDGKIHVIRNLIPRMNTVCIIGKIAYCFLQAIGKEIGATLTADQRGIDSPDNDGNDAIRACRDALTEAERRSVKVILPVDSAVLFDGEEGPRMISFESPPKTNKFRALDIGSETVSLIQAAVAEANSVIWNGPAGYYEDSRFKTGTLAIAEALARSSAKALVGGGDTLAALKEIGNESERIHQCTGGGAMLSLLMGKPLPAVEALLK